ncbi:energy transducer TonB [Roseivirga sp.]|uniref:energy transducer TonB n=1 Tax=Roseivirga sp. TaxID=1964215 RepID=UPI002B277AE4|nr:energy transducer TonB [Roseivirga sp.]
MSKPRKGEPLKTPQYRGGVQALKKFLSEQLNYPEEALKNKVEGVVEVAYDVDGLGRILNVKILTGLGSGCDEEVIRLVKMLVYETAINKGKNTLTHKKLKVDFKLPKPKKVATQYNYQLTPATTKPNPAKSKSGGYTITVNLNKK